jgi:hypothetical protein
MKAFQLLVIAAMTATLLAPVFRPTTARAASATLRVQATIRPWMQFSAHQHQSFFRVTAKDIRRGYIDLPRALSVDLRTNIQDRIRLDLINDGPEEILVSNAGSGNFGPGREALSISAPAAGVPVTRNLDLRVLLPGREKEGLHPLQVTLSPQAL